MDLERSELEHRKSLLQTDGSGHTHVGLSTMMLLLQEEMDLGPSCSHISGCPSLKCHGQGITVDRVAMARGELVTLSARESTPPPPPTVAKLLPPKWSIAGCASQLSSLHECIMSFSDVPGVRPGVKLLEEIRKGCRSARLSSGIELDEAAIDCFILDTLPKDLTSNSKKWLESGYRLPLAYPSLHAELNVICHLCFLNSLSGYRQAFHRNTGQGAHKNIVQIVLSCYLSDPAGDSAAPLSANTLVALNPMAILDILGLDTHVEKKHPLLPATIVGERRRDELYEALETLCVAANDTGKRLIEMKCPDLGTFVERSLKEVDAEGNNDEEKAALFANKVSKRRDKADRPGGG